MPKLNPIILAADLGYAVTAVKGGGTESASYTLKKDDRTVIVDQHLIDDIAAKVSPVTNPDTDSPIKAMG